MGILTRTNSAQPGVDWLRSILADGDSNKESEGLVRPLRTILITIGGLAGITAASAGVSWLRRREEEGQHERRASRS
jgi:hypothetical protein